MVRSLLHSGVLERRSTLRFALMFVGVCAMLASVPLWLGMADFDYHYSYAGQIENPSFYQKTETTPYRQLDSETRRIVDSAMNGRSYTFEDDTRTLPPLVSRGDTYHEFDARRVIDWTYSGTFAPIALGLVGFWLVFEAVQHERRQLGPRGY